MPILKEPSYLIFIVSNFLGTAHIGVELFLRKDVVLRNLEKRAKICRLKDLLKI